MLFQVEELSRTMELNSESVGLYRKPQSHDMEIESENKESICSTIFSGESYTLPMTEILL